MKNKIPGFLLEVEPQTLPRFKMISVSIYGDFKVKWQFIKKLLNINLEPR